MLPVVRAFGMGLYTPSGGNQSPPPMACHSLSHHPPRLHHTFSDALSHCRVTLSSRHLHRYYPRDQYQWLDFVERKNVRHCIEVRDKACFVYSTILCVCVVCALIVQRYCTSLCVYSACCVQSRGPVLCTVVLCVSPSWYARSAMTC
jgi:hypothetical protein